MIFRKFQKNTGLSVKNLFPLIICTVNSIAPAIANDSVITPAPAETFDRLLTMFNDDIFWAPASGFTENDYWPNIFGDETRSVFGPIPPITCKGESSSSFSAEVDGNQIQLTAVPEGEFAFQHRDHKGTVVVESEVVGRCDKPSLANTKGHLCDTSSRINYLNNQSNKNVDWVVLCRKNELGSALTSKDGYWHPDNPNFALLGIIGFNPRSGEVVFIDGTNLDYGLEKIATFQWNQPYPPPGGSGYNDPAGRAEAYKIYYHTQRIKCETCHDNKEPWIITPHLNYIGFGYKNSAREARFGANNVLPLTQPRPDDSPYRVIGTRFTKYADLSSKTLRDPTGSCTFCHTLTTDWTGSVLAYDAVGKVNNSERYKSFFERIARSRTDWAKKRENTHPWMVPWLGPNIKLNIDTGWIPSEIDEDNWNRLADCINETSNEDCQYKRVYTSCPAPESLKTECSNEDELNNTCTRLEDSFGPSEMKTSSTLLEGEIDESFPFNRKSTIAWTYQNGLGGVPQRDDVRFNLMILEVAIPGSNIEPALEEYPGLNETWDPYFTDPVRKNHIHYCDLEWNRTRTCHIFDPAQGRHLINNISYAGHLRNTTPEPTHTPRQYSVTIPTQCNKRYLARLVPKRFCFDRSGVLASSVDHIAYFDVTCALD